VIIQAIQYPHVITKCGKRIEISKIKGHPSPGKVLNDQYEVIGGDESNCEV